MKMNRRSWLKSASVATATGAFLSPYVQDSDFANPYPISLDMPG